MRRGHLPSIDTFTNSLTDTEGQGEPKDLAAASRDIVRRLWRHEGHGGLGFIRYPMLQERHIMACYNLKRKIGTVKFGWYGV